MTSAVSTTPGSGWSVTAVTPGTVVTSDNRVVKGNTVSFTTGAGNQGTVFVADSQFTPAIVRAMVAERAAIVDGVASLSDTGK